MAPTKHSNSTIISISSSSEGEDEDNQCESQSESEIEISSDEDDEEDYHDDECSGDEDDDDESELDDQEYEEEDEEHSDNHEQLDYGDGEDNDERICNRVIRLAKERSDVLNLSECKSYLRRHGLRLSGTKAECLQRINEHTRIKDGSGEALYPRSSFSINCTGDVCKGDVVLFTQKVYEKFDKMTRRGGLLGKRTIAGRVVKESYGAAKQQHTFTVEVLWTKGLKKLPPLFPLLVKGRNLYKLRTYRQRWKNEAERLKVLAEKHRRGAAARQIRAMRKTKNASCINAGTKRQKLSHSMPSQKKQATKRNRGKCAGRLGTAPVEHRKSNNHLQCPKLVELNGPKKDRLSAFQSNSYSSQNIFRREYHHSPGKSHRQTKVQGFTYPNSYRNPGSEDFNHGAHLHHASHSDPRNFNQYPRLMNVYQPMRPYYPGAEDYEHRNYPNSYRNPGSEDFNHGAHLHHASHSDPRNFNQYPRLMNVYQPMRPYYPGAEDYEHRNYGY